MHLSIVIDDSPGESSITVTRAPLVAECGFLPAQICEHSQEPLLVYQYPRAGLSLAAVTLPVQNCIAQGAGGKGGADFQGDASYGLFDIF